MADNWPRKSWLAGLLLVIVPVVACYPLANSVDGAGWFPVADMGFWVCVQYITMAAGMFSLWWLMGRSAPQRFTAQLRWLMVLAVLLRLSLIPVDSYTSNDIKRYLWDGKVALSGYDPYRTVPSDPSLQLLHAHWSPPPEHNAYATLYPPLAMAAFAFVAAAGPEWAPWVWKTAVALANIALLLVGLLLLKQLNQQRHMALLALSPVLVLEGGIAAHLDIFSALAIAIAVLYWLRRGYLIAGAAIAVGILFKLLPLVLLPLMLLLVNQWRGRWQLLLGCALILLAGYGAAYALGWQSIGVLFEFFAKWRFGSPVFTLLNEWLPEVARQMATALLAATGMWLALKLGRKDPLKGFALALAVPLLLSPVVFPWYLSVLVLFSAARPTLFLHGWLLLLPLSYEVLGGWLSQGAWQPADWVLVAVAAGWLLALAHWGFRLSGGRFYPPSTAADESRS
ncbi:MAG: hypothetical protein OIF34_05145 [Porticoccaceae bacterium]|nr:hypothetical protein [Porticoccaceae bacterium]